MFFHETSEGRGEQQPFTVFSEVTGFTRSPDFRNKKGSDLKNHRGPFGLYCIYRVVKGGVPRGGGSLIFPNVP